MRNWKYDQTRVFSVQVRVRKRVWMIMTKIIRQNISKEAIQAIMKGLKPYRKFNAKKYCGVIKLPQTPMEIQQSLRNEWD